MIVLTEDSRQLELSTSAAVTTDYYSAGIERVDPKYTSGKSRVVIERGWEEHGTTAGIGTVILTAIPREFYERRVLYVGVTNVGGAGPQVVTIKVDVLGAEVRLIGPVTLLNGESLFFTDG